jgi:hypothetical protein
LHGISLSLGGMMPHAAPAGTRELGANDS